MTRVIIGTGNIATGVSIVTGWVGESLTELNCPADSPVVIEGVSNFVKKRLSTLSFELVLPHTGAGGVDLPVALSAATAEELSIGTLNARTANFIQKLDLLDANRMGMFFNLIGVTGDNDPGPGNAAFNAAIPSDVTEIYLDVLDANSDGRDVSSLIALWTPGTVLLFRSMTTTAYAAFQVASIQVESGYRRILVNFIGSDGSLSIEPVEIGWFVIGTGVQIDFSDTFENRSTYDAAVKDKIFASINGADGLGPPTVLYQKLSATPGDWGPPIPFQGEESTPRIAVVSYDPGRPGDSEVVVSVIFDVPVDFPTNLNSPNSVSRSKAESVSTSNSVFSLRKNNVQFGTLTFPSGLSEGIFVTSSIHFDPGDQLTILAPSPRDATLARISITLAGIR